MNNKSTALQRTHVQRRLAIAALGMVAGITASLPAWAVTLEEVQDRGTLRVAIANEIPYGFTNMSGDAEGAGPKTVEHIAEALGIDDIEWVTTSFSSLIPGLQAGRFDVVAAEMAVMPDRCAQAIYSEPNTSYGEGLLVQAGNPKGIHGYQDFAERDDIRVAIMAGANQLEMLQQLGVPESQMVTINNNADAISTISTGRADAYAATGTTIGELAGRSNAVESAPDFVDPVIDGEEVRSWGAFTFANDSESLRDAFNQQLAEYKQSDEWREMIAGYGFTPEDIDASFERTTEALCSN